MAEITSAAYSIEPMAPLNSHDLGRFISPDEHVRWGDFLESLGGIAARVGARRTRIPVNAASLYVSLSDIRQIRPLERQTARGMAKTLRMAKSQLPEAQNRPLTVRFNQIMQFGSQAGSIIRIVAQLEAEGLQDDRNNIADSMHTVAPYLPPNNWNHNQVGNITLVRLTDPPSPSKVDDLAASLNQSIRGFSPLATLTPVGVIDFTKMKQRVLIQGPQQSS